MAEKHSILPNILWWISACIALTPILIDPGTNYPFITAKVSVFRILSILSFVLSLWWLFSQQVTVSTGNIFKKHKILSAWILLLLAFILSAVFGVDAYNSFWSGSERMIGIISWSSFLLSYISLVLLFSHDANKAKIFKYLILIGAGIVSISAILGYFGGFLLESYRGGRLTGLAGNPSYLAVYMLFASFLSLSLAFEEYEKNNNNGFILGLSGFLYFSLILFGTGTRGAMLGWGFGALGVLVYLIFRYKKNWIGKTSLAIVILGVISVGALFGLKDTSFVKHNLALSRLTSISVSDTTAQSRLFSYRTSLKAWPQKPIFGWGLENYKPAFLHNFIPDMVNNNPDDITFDKTHNMPLEILVTTGIVGFIAYLYFFYAAFLSLKQKVKLQEISPLSAVILSCGFLGYFVSNLFLFDVFESLLMMTVFLVMFTPKVNLSYEPKRTVPDAKRRLILCVLSVISVGAVVFSYIYVILPYNTSSNLNKAKNFLNAKQYDRSYSYLMKELSHETLASRDNLFTFVKNYISQRENLDSADKERFDLILKNYLEDLAQKHPTFQDIRTNLVYLLINRPDASMDDINEAKQISIGLAQYAPNYINYRTNLAFIYGLTKDYDKAMKEVNDILAITDKLASPYWYKGIILNMRGNKADKIAALDNFSMAIQKGYPPSSEELSIIVQQAIETESYDNLIVFYTEAIKLDTKNLQNYASLAAAYKEVGDYTNARITAQKMLELDPSVKPQVDAFLKTLPK